MLSLFFVAKRGKAQHPRLKHNNNKSTNDKFNTKKRTKQNNNNKARTLSTRFALPIEKKHSTLYTKTLRGFLSSNSSGFPKKYGSCESRASRDLGHKPKVDRRDLTSAMILISITYACFWHSTLETRPVSTQTLSVNNILPLREATE